MGSDLIVTTSRIQSATGMMHSSRPRCISDIPHPNSIAHNRQFGRFGLSCLPAHMCRCVRLLGPWDRCDVSQAGGFVSLVEMLSTPCKDVKVPFGSTSRKRLR